MTSPAIARPTSSRVGISALDVVGRLWPPLLLTALVLLALGQFLQVGLVSTDWWPVISTNQVRNLSEFIRAFQEPIGAGDPHFIKETARHYRPLATLSFALDYKLWGLNGADRKSTRLNSSHTVISYAVFCLKKKNKS